MADLLHGLRDEVADVDIPVRGNRRELCDLGCGSDGFCVGAEEVDDTGQRGLETRGRGPRGCFRLRFS